MTFCLLCIFVGFWIKILLLIFCRAFKGWNDSVPSSSTFTDTILHTSAWKPDRQRKFRIHLKKRKTYLKRKCTLAKRHSKATFSVKRSERSFMMLGLLVGCLFSLRQCQRRLLLKRTKMEVHSREQYSINSNTHSQ